MTIPFGVQLKIDRAKQHVYDLESAIGRFHDSQPYLIVREDEPKTGDQVFCIRIREQPPLALAGVIGDAIHNLRSGLNHLMVTLVIANGKKPSNATEFPIFQSDQAYRAGAAGKIEGASQQARRMIDALKPYKGGNDGFWQIHKLDLIDKHRTLVTVVGNYSFFTIDGGKMLRKLNPQLPVDLSMPVSIRPAERCPLKDGDPLFRIPKDSIGKVDDDPKFTFDVALNEPGVLECEPIHPTLVRLVDLVEGMIQPFGTLL